MENYTPKELVEQLNKYIIGQSSAKKAVAIALRNRYRRKKLPVDMQDDIVPKNIILIGPTGVGKTEIARRLARLVKAPFIKVEATKFTEVGYVGRDVESMIRDLVETSIRLVKSEKLSAVQGKAEELSNDRIVDILIPNHRESKAMNNPFNMLFGEQQHTEMDNTKEKEALHEKRQRRKEIRRRLKSGEIEDKYIEIEVEDTNTPMLEVFSGSGMEEMGINFQDMLGNMFPKKKKKRRVTIEEARKILAQEEAQKLIDMDEVVATAVSRAEESGIIFLDEIDKIATKEGGSNQDVSRGGVQRDILPIVEGSTIMTKYGPVKTDFILFIAAGAFHISKPSDLIPELQGRFPIRVELDNLSQEDFKQILTEPKNSIIRQCKELLATEGLKLEFTIDAVEEIAHIAYTVNKQTENIGARRLHTIIEKLLEDISFEAPNIEKNDLSINREFVKEKLSDIIENEDLSKYIL